MNAQRTLRRPIACARIGLHSGKKVTLSLKPAPSDFGVRFRRSDLGGLEVPAHVGHVGGINLATGLHFDDIKKLLGVLRSLTEKGNTVVVIEHNLDVIRTADWIVDLGPEGGDAGGSILAEGTPEDVAAVRSSYTGQFLRRALAAEKKRARA